MAYTLMFLKLTFVNTDGSDRKYMTLLKLFLGATKLGILKSEEMQQTFYLAHENHRRVIGLCFTKQKQFMICLKDLLYYKSCYSLAIHTFVQSKIP